MKSNIRPLLAVALLAWPGLAFAQGTITDQEEHILRGFFDRQTINVGYAKLALKQGSTAQVKKFAQDELDLYTKLGDQVAATDKEFCLVTSPMKAGAMPPELSQGTSRGVCNPTGGTTAFGPNIQSVVAGTGGGNPFGGGAPGGGAPGGGRPGGAPGGGARMAGPNPNSGVDDTAMLSKLSGKEFDQEYALRTAMLHVRMENFAINEMNNPAANPALVAFLKTALQEINAQSNAAFAVYSGEQPRGARRPGGGAGGGAPGGASPG